MALAEKGDFMLFADDMTFRVSNKFLLREVLTELKKLGTQANLELSFDKTQMICSQ
jgi:hypothetical protein